MDEDLERLAGELEILLAEVDQMITKKNAAKKVAMTGPCRVNEIAEVVTETSAVAQIRVFADRLPSQH